MAAHVLTCKLTDGTTQTTTVPPTTTPDAWVAHLKQQGGFWSDRNLQGQGGQSAGTIFVPWHAVVSVTYTS